MKKQCTKCKQYKSISDFNIRKDSKIGLSSHCKSCILKCRRNYRKNNPEKTKEQDKRYSENRKDAIIKYRESHREEAKKRTIEWRNSHPWYDKKYREDHKKQRQERNALPVNREKANLRGRLNRKNPIKHKKLKEWRRSYSKKIRKRYPLQKLIDSIRVRTRDAFNGKGWIKNKTTEELIGCNYEFLKKHIESQFTKGMLWANYGLFGWHIDHRIPLSSAKNEKELYKLCHYTNLQPLWWYDNLSKRDKIML